MASTKVLQMDEKVVKLQEYGTGYRMMDDPFFQANNTVIFKPFVRLGVYRLDDEDLCHKSNRVRCNIPNCNQEFDTIFAYESHYNSLHRFLCAQCSKNLPSAHLLDLHLSEMHDSFFAVQAERKPMYRCYLEECLQLSQNATDRRNHCITVHKFPSDFRFDNHAKKKSNNNNSNTNDSKKSNPKSTKSKASSVLQPQKLVSVATHDEDIELEDKSILLTAQRKHYTNFSFGHKKSKSFQSNGSHSYAKLLAAKSGNTTSSSTSTSTSKETSVLENSTNMVDDLMESLPQ